MCQDFAGIVSLYSSFTVNVMTGIRSKIKKNETNFNKTSKYQNSLIRHQIRCNFTSNNISNLILFRQI